MTEARTTDRVDRAINVAYLLLLGGWIAFVVVMAVPGCRGQLLAGWSWLRYYRWRARWESMQPWQQEALIVRGRGPVS